MKRREWLVTMAGSLAALRERMQAAAPSDDVNIKWAVSMFLWTSTQWTASSHNFTDMLDVIKDTGFEGFRLTGWPKSLESYGMPPARLLKELSKRDLRIVTLSFGGPADDPSQHAAIVKKAHAACKLLNDFGATEMVVLSPRRPNKVLMRHNMGIACEFWNRLGDLCADYGIRAGLHNHSQGQLVESQDEVELMLKLTDPKRFHWSPDTVHLYLGGCDVVDLFERYGHRLMFMDYVDVKYVYADTDYKLANGLTAEAGTHSATFMLCNQDFGDGVLDLPALHGVLKKNSYKGWICIDHHYTPVSPRHSFTKCRKYIHERLEPIYS